MQPAVGRAHRKEVGARVDGPEDVEEAVGEYANDVMMANRVVIAPKFEHALRVVASKFGAVGAPDVHETLGWSDGPARVGRRIAPMIMSS